MNAQIEKGKPMKIVGCTSDISEMEMQHRHSGNGWCVIEVEDQEFCRVVAISMGGIGSQVFRVWQRALKPYGPLKEVTIEAANALRQLLLTGAVRIVSTRIEKV